MGPGDLTVNCFPEDNPVTSLSRWIDWKFPLYITHFDFSVNNKLLKYICNKINQVKMLHWNIYPSNPVELSLSCICAIMKFAGDWLYDTFFANTHIFLLVTNDMIYKSGSVSDLLDYINPNHDAKGRDGAVRRKSYIAKVSWSLDHVWSKLI